MHPPRWFFILFIVLGINVAIVLSTSIWHLAVADERTTPGGTEANGTGDTPLNPIDVPNESDATTDQVVQPIAQNQSTGTENGEPTDGIAQLPEVASVPARIESLEHGLPAIPPLGDLESRENDPVLREFQSYFSANQGDEPLKAFAADGVLQSNDYYVTLDQRLATVARLTASARSIAQEAAKLSRDGESGKAARLLKMSAQLREMAASLLVFEL